jgi:hypothetical protein
MPPRLGLDLDYREIGRLLTGRGPWRYAEAVRIVSGTCTCSDDCEAYEVEIGGSPETLRRCESLRLAEMFPELLSHPEGYQLLVPETAAVE